MHTVTAPLPVGAPCTVALDWDRRFDHMQHHTARAHMPINCFNSISASHTCRMLSSRCTPPPLLAEH